MVIEKVIEQAYCEQLITMQRMVTSYPFSKLEKTMRVTLNKALIFVLHLYPRLSHMEAKQLVTEIYLNSKRATADLNEDYSEYIICNTKIKDDYFTLDMLPCIFSAFHFSAYKLITRVLIKVGVNIAVLVSSDLSKNMSEEIQISNEMAEKNGWGGRALLVDTSSPLMIRKLLKLTKNGWSLLIYADGSTGSDGMERKGNNSITVDFFNVKLHVRKGLAVIAQLSKLPIVPIYCYFESLCTRKLVLKKPIDVQNLSNDKHSTLMQQIYEIHQIEVAKQPAHWEGFLFLLKFVEPARNNSYLGIGEKPNSTSSKTYFYRVNKSNFAFVEFHDGFFSVRLSDLKFIRLTQELYQRFQKCEPLFSPQDLGLTEYNQLEKLEQLGLIEANQLPN